MGPVGIISPAFNASSKSSNCVAFRVCVKHSSHGSTGGVGGIGVVSLPPPITVLLLLFMQMNLKSLI